MNQIWPQRLACDCLVADLASSSALTLRIGVGSEQEFGGGDARRCRDRLYGAIVLTGTRALGKSSVLEKLETLLEIESIAFGALEFEQLSWGSPPLRGEPWLAQLSAVMELQRDAGRRLFLIAATGEELAAV